VVRLGLGFMHTILLAICGSKQDISYLIQSLTPVRVLLYYNMPVKILDSLLHGMVLSATCLLSQTGFQEVSLVFLVRNANPMI
jgi:hypothetical protein